MKGIFGLAFKLLISDSAKFTALLVGIAFAVSAQLGKIVVDRHQRRGEDLGDGSAVQTMVDSVGMPALIWFQRKTALAHLKTTSMRSKHGPARWVRSLRV